MFTGQARNSASTYPHLSATLPSFIIKAILAQLASLQLKRDLLKEKDCENTLLHNWTHSLHNTKLSTNGTQ
jgi:hypothetical protein